MKKYTREEIKEIVDLVFKESPKTIPIYMGPKQWELMDEFFKEELERMKVKLDKDDK